MNYITIFVIVIIERYHERNSIKSIQVYQF